MSTMIPFKRALRDFVYLDWEKVRSLAAQLLEGIPEDEKREHRQESGVKGRLEASALNLLKGGGEIDYRYFRSNNETRSFHHHVYSLFEDDLIEKSIVTVIEKDFDAERWIPESFYDGQFILVTGLLRIMDYGWVASSMESIPRMQRLSHNAEQHSLQEQVNKGVISRQEMEAKLHKQRKTQGEIKALKIDELTELARRLYGDSIRIKVVPDKDKPWRMFVGTGQPANFYDSATSLGQKYGVEVDADWVVLGQVNFPGNSRTPAPLPIGNQLEDAFEGMFLFANSLVRMAGAVEFPVVSFTPISIYRAVNY